MKTGFITGASRGFARRSERLTLSEGDQVIATARGEEAVGDAMGAEAKFLAAAEAAAG